MLKVLVAVDGSEHSDRAVNHLIKLHQTKEKMDIHLLNVQPPVESGHARMFINKEDLERYYREEAKLALDRARKLLDRAGVPHTEHLAVGRVVDTIVNFAREQQFDQIVMGTFGRSGLAHMLMGSVASAVLQLSDIPVTLVK